MGLWNMMFITMYSKKHAKRHFICVSWSSGAVNQHEFNLSQKTILQLPKQDVGDQVTRRDSDSVCVQIHGWMEEGGGRLPGGCSSEGFLILCHCLGADCQLQRGQ